MGELFIKGQKTPSITNPWREAQIILENWHFFEPRVLFFICLVFCWFRGGFFFAFPRVAAAAPTASETCSNHTCGAVFRACVRRCLPLPLLFLAFAPHGPQTLKYPGACSSTPTFRTRWAATCHSESTPRRGRVAVFPRGCGTVTTGLLLRFGRGGFERFALGGLACGADLLVPFRGSHRHEFATSSCELLRASGRDSRPASARSRRGQGRGTGEQASTRPSGGTSDCGPERASASQCEVARDSARKQARATARQREKTRSSASQREQTRASASQRKRKPARGAWGGAYRANARRKGANQLHIFNFFLKGGLSRNSPKYRIWGDPLLRDKKRPI